jgi:hypothetical protein
MATPTYTYAIQPAGGGNIKIGRTDQSPADRLAALQTGSPLPLVLVGFTRCDIEAEAHRTLSAHRLHGEWFMPNREVLRFVQERLAMGENSPLATEHAHTPAAPPLLTDPQATAYLSLAPGSNTLAKWRGSSTGPPFIRINERCIRYRRDDLAAWIEAHCVGGGQ